MKIAAIDHIALNIADVDRSLLFYHEILGLPTERLEEFRAGRSGFPSVRVSDHTVVDLFPSGAAAGSPNLNHFCFILGEGELQRLRDSLLQHEVEIVEEPVSRWGAQGWGLSMKVRDPDGNIVELKEAVTVDRTAEV